MDFQGFISELKARNVVRVAGIYAVAAWGVFTIGKTVLETMDFPEKAPLFLLIACIMGLPVAMGLSWIYERGPDGKVRRARRAEEGAPKKRLNLLDWGFLGAVATILVVFVVSAFGLSAALNGAGNKSVAVLPFASFSTQAETEYFADGLTEEVINSLAQVEDLKVAGRTSAFYFKGRNEDLREIGRKLNVAHVVEGSVRRDGEKLRVTAQLIRVSNGYHMWSKTYDRTMDDAFAIQEEVANGVAEALLVELKAGGRARPAKRNPQAYEMELVANGLLRRKGKAQIEAAQDIYRKLIELEPNNAEAYADYAYATAYLTQNHLEGDFLPSVRDAEEKIAKALELDPKSSAAYVAKGAVHAIRFRREGRHASEAEAEAAYKQAVELDPRNPEALSLLGAFIAPRRPEEAISYLRRALEVDPLDRIGRNALAAALFDTGHPEEAEQQYRANVDLFPDWVDAKQELGEMLLYQGKLDKAVPWYRLASKPMTDPAASVQLANIYYNLGMPREAEGAMRPWSGHPVVGGLSRSLEMIVAGDFRGLIAFSQAKLKEPEADPIWRSGVVLGGMMLSDFETAREQLLITSPELFEPAPKVSPLLATEALEAAYVIDQTGDKGQARRIVAMVLSVTETKPGLRQQNDRAVARVKAHVMLGDKEKALAELRAAIDNGYRDLIDLSLFVRLEAYPAMAPIRADPRFQAMIAEVEADNARMRSALIAQDQKVAKK